MIILDSMKKSLILIIILSLVFNCSKSNIEPTKNLQATFYKGMDLSFQSELEAYNILYKDANNHPIELLDFVSNNGTNLVRLKLWHTPKDGQNSLLKVIAYAKRIKNKNMHFLLDFHYSDYWADPGKQTPPEAWQNMNYDEIKIALYNYTKNVVQELKNKNVLPEIIQIGNETDSGFLWNHGKVWNEFSNNWENYAGLLYEAIKAVKEVDNSIKIMLHHSSVENAIYFFNELKPFNIDFDMIGLSYYPQFQIKDLGIIQSKLNELALTFNKEILIVETAYPFTLQWNDNNTNYIGYSNQVLSEFPTTPEGQKTYLQWLVSTIKKIPNNKGVGFCYWAPDWVAFNGNEVTSTKGSSWENQCLFDFNYNALPAFDAFKTN